VHQIDDIADYVTYLQDSDREAGILFKELLIGVTNFFRDSEAFKKLRSVALPIILKGKPADYTIRAWVPGCSSGEEAYSVAILLHETLEVLKLHFNVQVFGTDIDGSAIELAHAGIYPESITADVSPTRLERYFSREEDGQYRIRKVIREMLVFAPHNIIKDPPFTKLDLLCCRNLLIYLGPELQKKLLPLFHDSLKPDGLLFLGSSESIGQATDLFSPLDKRWKFFQRKASPILTHPALELPISASHGLEEMTNGDERTKRAEEVSALRLVEAILQQSDTPPCVIIDDRSDVIYIHGRTGRFLEPAEGKTSVNVLDMARGGLRAELTASIQRASTLNQEVIVKNVKVQEDDSQIFVDLTIRPILEQSGLRGMLMVIFDQTAGPKKKSADRAVSRGGKSLADLENELQNTQENLQTTIEELETSKEELQSLNEESATVNAELQSRIDDLSRANDDMKNQLDSTDVAAGPDDASNP
jgi:two-component system CheB/CheR fusion protein